MDLLRQGFSTVETAKKLSMGLRTIRRWTSFRSRTGTFARDAIRGPGRPRSLGAEQTRQLSQALLREKKALGLPPGRWKTADIQRIVAFFYGLRMSPNSIETL